MTDRVETAALLFERKFNCAQAVLAAYAPGLGLDEATALRLASPFGGGIGRRGELCGAVSGALLALGLGRGNDTPEGKEATYRLTQDFLERFEARHGSLLCRQLTGCDLRDPADHERARREGVFAERCPLFVRSAAGLLESCLEDGG